MNKFKDQRQHSNQLHLKYIEMFMYKQLVYIYTKSSKLMLH